MTGSIVVTTKEELRQRLAELDSLVLGFVPTMGALHVGHEALIARARADCDRVIVSVFVNPLQFSPDDDFERYPRDLAADIQVASRAGADLIFAPLSRDFLDDSMLTTVAVSKVSEGLCGRERPGHFTGVATILTKFFNLISPNKAYFGEKDWQQLQIVRRLSRDLDFPIDIVGVATVREPDGLAVSSRNRYLDAAQREAAAVLPQAMRSAASMVAKGERESRVLTALFTEIIAAEPQLRLEYFAVCLPETLAAVDIVDGPTLLAAAVWVGQTRLIDNMLVST